MNTRIIIAGIGGVGGYFGGLLAAYYHEDGDVEVHFIARGAHLKKIRQDGLTLITRGNARVVHPTGATDHPSEIGIVDFILICTKNYDLEMIVDQLRPCIGKRTVLLPLLNGVDSLERIKTLVPTANVWNGFAYIVSRLRAPGIVDNFGNIQTLCFGLDDTQDDILTGFEMLLKKAGIEATCSPDISRQMWEKFIFISPIATITSYLDLNFGRLRADEKAMRMLSQLIDEVIAVARKKGIRTDDNVLEKTMRRMQSLVPETTSSMHSDFQRDPRRTELETLTGYVVREGIRLTISTPTYTMMYEILKQKAGMP